MLCEGSISMVVAGEAENESGPHIFNILLLIFLQ